MHTTHSNIQCKNESKHSEMGPVRQNPIQRTVSLETRLNWWFCCKMAVLKRFNKLSFVSTQNSTHTQTEWMNLTLVLKTRHTAGHRNDTLSQPMNTVTSNCTACNMSALLTNNFNGLLGTLFIHDFSFFRLRQTTTSADCLSQCLTCITTHSQSSASLLHHYSHTSLSPVVMQQGGW